MTMSQTQQLGHTIITGLFLLLIMATSYFVYYEFTKPSITATDSESENVGRVIRDYTPINPVSIAADPATPPHSEDRAANSDVTEAVSETLPPSATEVTAENSHTQVEIETTMAPESVAEVPSTPSPATQTPPTTETETVETAITTDTDTPPAVATAATEPNTDSPPAASEQPATAEPQMTDEASDSTTAKMPTPSPEPAVKTPIDPAETPEDTRIVDTEPTLDDGDIDTTSVTTDLNTEEASAVETTVETTHTTDIPSIAADATTETTKTTVVTSAPNIEANDTLPPALEASELVSDTIVDAVESSDPPAPQPPVTVAEVSTEPTEAVITETESVTPSPTEIESVGIFLPATLKYNDLFPANEVLVLTIELENDTPHALSPVAGTINIYDTETQFIGSFSLAEYDILGETERQRRYNLPSGQRKTWGIKVAASEHPDLYDELKNSKVAAYEVTFLLKTGGTP